MFCFKCGAQLLDGSLFCTFCGQKQPLIVDGKIVEAPTADPTPVNESGNTADNTEWESWSDDDEDEDVQYNSLEDSHDQLVNAEARFTEDGAMIIPKEVAESGCYMACKWFETHQDSGNYAIEDGTAVIRSLTGEKYVFVSNTIIRSITIPESVTKIDRYAFNGCTSLNISIPASLTYIPDNAFEGCASVKRRLY